jgi:maltokinase
MRIDEPTLLPLLQSHVPGQRWFGASSVESIDRMTVLRKDLPALLQVLVRGNDGDRYQVVIGLRSAGDEQPWFEGKAGAVLGRIDDDDEGELVVYDASIDPELSIELLRDVLPGVDVSRARPLGAEQSNTSLVFDERVVLKLFRRLPDGPNPDVEVTRALAEHGYSHVVAPVGEWRDDDGDYAVATELLIGAADGWQVALTSLHDLYDRRVAPEEAAGDFGFEAERLGRTIAELHVAMAEAFGVVEPDVDAWITDMAAQLARIDLSAKQARAARRVYESLRDVDAGPSFRVHGDLHLGQTLLHDMGWFVLDFEGEPARPIEERRRPSSPLRDVAGMVRSLHYAARVALRDIGGGDDAELRDLADAWERHNAERFLAGYSGYGDAARILPPGEARATVQRAFELDKAVYEVGYEQGHRPDWADIPLSAVRRLLEV